MAAAPLLEVNVVFRVPDASRGDTTSLNRVTDVAIDDRGHVYITDFRTGCARRLDAQGLPIGVLGGDGRGPGECVTPSHVAVRGDTVAVYERGSIHVFTGDVYDRTIPGNADLARAVDLALTDVGIIAAIRSFHRQERDRDTVALRVVNGATGRLERTLLTLPMPGMIGTSPSWYPPLSARPRVSITTSGVAYFTSGDSFLIQKVGIAGDTEAVARLDVPRVPATRERLARAQATLVADMQRPDLARAVSGTPSPEYVPAISALLASPTGHLAVRRADMDDDTAEHWFMLKPDGTVAGRFRILHGFQAMAFRDCRLTGVTRDSLDQQSVVQLQIGAQRDGC